MTAVVATVELLTSGQMRRYAELRGYTSNPAEHHRPNHSD
jgi:hypothetical protein